MPSQNQIVSGTILLVTLPGCESGQWVVRTEKHFSEDMGGGSQTFEETVPETGTGSIHRALDKLREMVTMSPARRSVGGGQ